MKEKYRGFTLTIETNSCEIVKTPSRPAFFTALKTMVFDTSIEAKNFIDLQFYF